MKRSRTLWLFATLITLASAVYQRVTGPTYPVRVRGHLAGAEIRARLARTHAGEGNQVVAVQASDPAVRGVLRWKRFKTADAFQDVPMVRAGETLQAELPHQPAAGKLQYEVALDRGGDALRLPMTVIRFRGDVPAAVLIIHVIAMFGGMLLSTRAGLAGWARETNLRPLMMWTLGFLIIGGFLLGPIVQKYAFDAFWTGWPFGTDLTDNKTAAAIVFWLAAYFAYGRVRSPHAWMIAASIATLAVFMIPHSVLGSELDYTKAAK